MEKIVVIGGGISGFIFAINSKRKNNEVIILERGNNPLKKLLLTGNGRCNYFNEDFDIKYYNSENIEILKQYIIKENKEKILAFFTRIGIIPKIKNGYYYPHSNKAISMKNALLKESEIKRIKIKTESYVKDIKLENNKFKLELENETIICDKLAISTGSKSYPKTGSDGNGYVLAEKLGHTTTAILPSLVQLHAEENFFKELSGVRCEGKVSLYENNKKIKEEKGEIQFTNYGLSGICIFNLSGLISKGLNEHKKEEIVINFLEDLNINKKEELENYLDQKNKETTKRTISEILDNLFDYKLTNVILKKSKINRESLYQNLSQKEKERLITNIISFKINIIDTNSYENAQVCIGGIPLNEITENFESTKVNNLYFTGEILDVSGNCGGYNIGFAALSGIIAGNHAGGEND